MHCFTLPILLLIVFSSHGLSSRSQPQHIQHLFVVLPMAEDHSPRLCLGEDRKLEQQLWTIPRALSCFTTVMILKSKSPVEPQSHPLPAQDSNGHSKTNIPLQELLFPLPISLKMEKGLFVLSPTLTTE